MAQVLGEGRMPTNKQITEFEKRFRAYDDARKAIDSELFGVEVPQMLKAEEILTTFKEQKRLIRETKATTGIDLAKGKGDVYIHEAIKDQMNEFIKPAKSMVDEAAKVLGFDYATGLFKSYVTTLFPGFHVRNITSNQFQNMLKIGVDVANPKLNAAAWAILRNKRPDSVFTSKGGRVYTYGQIRDMISKESDILMEGRFGPFELQQAQIKGEVLGGTKKRLTRDLNPLSRENLALKAGQKIGQSSEQHAKLVNILSNLQAGNSIKVGIESAEDALFNYGKLTDFERKIMRRIIPFYTFSRKNAEYQMKMLMQTPGAVAAQLKGMRGASETLGGAITSEDVEGLPAWALDNMGVKSGVNKYGQNLFLTGFGLPIEEFFGRFSGDKGIIWNIINETLLMSNPLLKYPLEKVTGFDMFRGRPIQELNNAEDIQGILKLMPGPVGEQFAKFMEFREIPGVPVYVDL